MPAGALRWLLPAALLRCPLAGGAGEPPARPQGGSNLTVLTQDDFEGRLLSGTWFVEFFVSWCPHCKSLASRWEELADVVVSDGWAVKIAQMDCTHIREACTRMHVRAYPTLALMQDGQLQANYMGPPEISDFKDFVDEHDTSGPGGGGGEEARIGGGPQQVGGGGWTPLLWPQSGGGPVAELSIGSPPQTVQCLLDTGTTDVWVPARGCQGCGRGGSFDPGTSSSFVKVDESIRVSQGRHWVSGRAAEEAVGLGPIEAQNQSVLLVDEASLPAGRGWDGVCGLGRPRGAGSAVREARGASLFSRLPGAGPEATVALLPGGGNLSFMTVGSVPEGAAREDTLAWAQPVDEGDGTAWVVQGGVAVTKPEARPFKFIVDTRTEEVLLVPKVYYEPLVMSLLPDNSYGALCKMQKDEARTVDCNCSVLEDRMLLPLRLAFGGRHFEVPLQQLFARSPAASGGGQDGPGAGRCALRIRQKAEAFRREAGPRRLHGAGALADGAAEGEDEPWILGGGFLRLFVAVLDFGTGRLGIAEAPGVPGGASAERAGASRLFEAAAAAPAAPRGSAAAGAAGPRRAPRGAAACAALGAALLAAAAGPRLARGALGRAGPRGAAGSPGCEGLPLVAAGELEAALA